MTQKRTLKQPEPELGMGVTCFGKNGRYPGTIVCVDFSPKTGKPDCVVVQLDCVDGGKIIPDLEGEIQEFLLNYKKGIWCRVHRKYKSPTTSVDTKTNGGIRTLAWTHKDRSDIFFGRRLHPHSGEL